MNTTKNIDADRSSALLGALRQIVEDANDVRGMADRAQCNSAGRMMEKCDFIIANAEDALSLIAPNGKAEQS